MTKRGLIRLAAWLPAVLVLGFALFRASGLHAGYPLYPLLAFTPYAALAGLLALIWAALLRERWAACAALAATLVLTALVGPRLLAGDGAAASSPATSFRVMTLNLSFGDADIEEIADLVRAQRVDLLAVQELTPGAAQALAGGPVGAALPNRLLDARPGAVGVGLFSRVPLRELQQPRLSASNPTVAALARPPDGDAVEVWTVHPLPPSSSANVEALSRHLDAIPAPDPAGPPRLLLGDFNSTLDHPDLRAVLDRGYRDAADALGEGLTPTWPSDGFPPGVVIDHALGDERIEFSEYSVHDVSGSDHKAVVVSLGLAP